ncbi:hypothetical protein WJX72_001327 [[Myrmecia] bisecta]
MDHFCSPDCELSPWNRLLLRAVLALHMQMTGDLDVLLQAKVRDCSNTIAPRPYDGPQPLFQIVDPVAKYPRAYQHIRHASALYCAVGSVADLWGFKWARDDSKDTLWLREMDDATFDSLLLLHPEGKIHEPLSADFVLREVHKALQKLGIEAAAATLRTFLWRSRSNIADGMSEFLIGAKVRGEGRIPSREARIRFLQLLTDMRPTLLQDASIKIKGFGPSYPLSDLPAFAKPVFTKYQRQVNQLDQKGVMRGTGAAWCAQCGVRTTEEKPLRPCSKCKVPYYCGRECQTLHWHAQHKAQCRSLRET